MLRRLHSSSPDLRGGIPGLDPHPLPPDPRPRVRPGWGGAHSPALAPSPKRHHPSPTHTGWAPAQGMRQLWAHLCRPPSPGHLEPAPCHLPGLSLGLPVRPGVLLCFQALLPKHFPPPRVHRGSFDKWPPSQTSLRKVSPGTAHSPLQTGPPHLRRAPFPTQETPPHSETLLFTRESPSPWSMHRPRSWGPLPAPEGPASIPYTRAEVRRPGDCGVQREGPRYPAL